MALGGVNALVGLDLPADVLAGNSLVVSRRGAAVGVWWEAAPGELVEVLDSRDSQVREIAPLDVVVDDPDLLRVLNGQSLAAVHIKGVAKSPVAPPPHSPLRTSCAVSTDTSTTSFRTSSSLAISGPWIVTRTFWRRVSRGR